MHSIQITEFPPGRRRQKSVGRWGFACSSTGTPCFTALRCTGLHRCGVFFTNRRQDPLPAKRSQLALLLCPGNKPTISREYANIGNGSYFGTKSPVNSLQTLWTRNCSERSQQTDPINSHLPHESPGDTRHSLPHGFWRKGNEISVERPWSDMGDISLLPRIAKAIKVRHEEQEGDSENDAWPYCSAVRSCSCPAAGAHTWVCTAACKLFFACLISSVDGEQQSCSWITTRDTRPLVCSLADENLIDWLLPGSLRGSLGPVGWAL